MPSVMLSMFHVPYSMIPVPFHVSQPSKSLMMMKASPSEPVVRTAPVGKVFS
jgi:hypothetical protein